MIRVIKHRVSNINGHADVNFAKLSGLHSQIGNRNVQSTKAFQFPSVFISKDSLSSQKKASLRVNTAFVTPMFLYELQKVIGTIRMF